MFYLADGGQSCDAACAAKGQKCDLLAITHIATEVSICKDTINGLGFSTGGGGRFKDDDSGCTYHPGQAGHHQLMDKSRTASPTCDEVNNDISRRRVCACSNRGTLTNIDFVFAITFYKLDFNTIIYYK